MNFNIQALMKLYLISKPEFLIAENKILEDFMGMGNFIFHVRKPYASFVETIDFINSISPKFHSRIITHQHHEIINDVNLGGLHFTSEKKISLSINEINSLRKKYPNITLSSSLHQLSEVQHASSIFNYAFLSPVFDSISKKGYFSSLNLEETKKKIKHIKSIHPGFSIIALGGVEASRIPILQELGFEGAAVMGTIWEDESPRQKMLELLKFTAQL